MNEILNEAFITMFTLNPDIQDKFFKDYIATAADSDEFKGEEDERKSKYPYLHSTYNLSMSTYFLKELGAYKIAAVTLLQALLKSTHFTSLGGKQGRRKVSNIGAAHT